MNTFFHKSLAVLTAFVVLFSTISFSIDMHYCGEALVDMAFFEKAETCGMEREENLENPECSVSKKNCCSDKHIFIKGQEDLKQTVRSFSFEQPLLIASFPCSYTFCIEQNKFSKKTYKPPLIVRNIQQLDEVYLI